MRISTQLQHLTILTTLDIEKIDNEVEHNSESQTAVENDEDYKQVLRLLIKAIVEVGSLHDHALCLQLHLKSDDQYC